VSVEEPRIEDFPSLAAFGEALVASPATRRRPWPFLGGVALLPLLGLVAVTTASTAAGLTVLTGSPIPPPLRADDTASVRPTAGTAWLSEVRADDPAGGPAWTVRVARGPAGETCVVAGQVRGGRFGIVGRDRRFRDLPDEYGGCASPPLPGRPIVAMRAVAPKVQGWERPVGSSVLHGVGGPELDEVVVRPAIEPAHRLQIGRDGTFAAVLHGLPDQAQPRVELRWRDGRRRTLDFRQPSVVPDPLGARPWIVEATSRETVVERRRDRRPPPSITCFGVLGGEWFGASACGMSRREAWVVQVERASRPVVRQAGPRARWFASATWAHPSRTLVLVRARPGAAVTVAARGRRWPVRWSGSAGGGGRRSDAGWTAVLPPGVSAREVRVQVARGGRVATSRVVGRDPGQAANGGRR